VAHVIKSRPDSGLDFEVKALQTSKGVPYSLGYAEAGRESESGARERAGGREEERE
jgi:hypothetical protein